MTGNRITQVATPTEAEDPPPANTWTGDFAVKRTTIQARRGLGAAYYAYGNESEKEQHKLGSVIVAVREFRTAEEPPDRERFPVLRVRCHLTVPDEPPAAGEVRLDQTVRNALGIPVVPEQEHTVSLAPLSRSWLTVHRERAGDWLLRRRYMFMRVRKADPGDMEKRLVRIPEDSFRLLGIAPGEKVRLTHPSLGEGGKYDEKRCTLQAYPLTDSIAGRQEDNTAWGVFDRYPDPQKLFGVTPDICPIYLDESAREELDVRTLEVVRVRRADTDAFAQRIRSFGLAIAAAAIAIIGVFPIEKSIAHGLEVLLGALVVALVFAVLNLRASSYGSAG